MFGLLVWITFIWITSRAGITAIRPSNVFLADRLDATTPCNFGEFWKNNNSCQQCTFCGQTQNVVSICTELQDTVCECKSGTFLSAAGEDSKCQQCQICADGSAIIAECTSTSNTQCSSCPEGKFLEVKSNSCQDCSICSSTEIEMRACGSVADTVCIPYNISWDHQRSEHENVIVQQVDQFELPHALRPAFPSRRSLAGQLPQRPLSFARDRSASSVFFLDESLHPLYYLAPGIVIVVVVCYTAFKSCESSNRRKISFSCWKSAFRSSETSVPDVERGCLVNRGPAIALLRPPFPIPFLPQDQMHFVPHRNTLLCTETQNELFNTTVFSRS